MKTLIFSLCFLSLTIGGCNDITSHKEKESFQSGVLKVQNEFAPSEESWGNSEEQKVVANPPPPPPKPPKMRSNINESQSTKEVKLIKDGQIYIQCKNLYTTKKNIDDLIKVNKGYYSNERLSKTDYEVVYDLELRIPASRFEKVISRLEKGKDEITEKNINSRDVTEEYYDLETRLENKNAYLKRYRELLGRANSMSEVLAIEENIRTLEEEIESSVGHLNYLKNQVEYSTLLINLATEIEKSTSDDTPSFLSKTGNALTKGIDLIMDFIVWIISIWPVDIIVILLVIWIIRKRKNKIKKNNL
jgi:hypothetical protein